MKAKRGIGGGSPHSDPGAITRDEVRVLQQGGAPDAPRRRRGGPSASRCQSTRYRCARSAFFRNELMVGRLR